MVIEEEIYNKLVEQFSIGEICVKKWGKRKQLTWVSFINLALRLDPSDLYKSCGFNSANTFSRYFREHFLSIMVTKDNQPFKYFLPSTINLRKCFDCRIYKALSDFNDSSTNINYQCKVCKRDYDYLYRLQNKKQIKQKLINTREYRLITYSKYYEDNKNAISSKQKRYYLLNKSDFIARNAKRRAAKLQATPNWADGEIIKQIYATCPEGYHVDHIVPLQNDLVCGLHCEFNLQHLTVAENLTKSNKFIL